MQAAERIMADEGYSHLSVDRLVTEIGTTRPTFYRRYANLAHLVLDVLNSHYTRPAYQTTGSLRGDLLRFQRDEITALSSPLFRHNLAGLMEPLRLDPAVRELFAEYFTVPRRTRLEAILEAAAERDEIEAGAVPVETVRDLLMGPVLARLMLPLDSPVDDALARSTVQAVCELLGAGAEGEHPLC